MIDITLHSWQALAVTSTFIYGVMNFLYKVAAEHKCSSFYIMSFSGLTVSILSLSAIIINKSAFIPLKWILAFAVMNALFFALSSICKIEALKYIPANLTFPVVKLNSIFAVLIAIIIFGERPDIFKISGIILGLLVIAILTAEKWEPKDKLNMQKGFMFSLIAASATALSMTIGKVASQSVPKINYIFISYTMVAIYSYFGSSVIRKKDNTSHELNRETIILGVIIGTLNLAGYFLVLKSLSIGPMSGVQPIFAMSIIIPISLSRLIYKEKFTKLRIFAVILSLASILLVSIK